MDTYFGECEDDPRTCYNAYLPEVLRRTVVQDAFTRVYVYADRFHPQEGAQFSSWAYAILIRLCLRGTPS